MTISGTLGFELMIGCEVTAIHQSVRGFIELPIDLQNSYTLVLDADPNDPTIPHSNILRDINDWTQSTRDIITEEGRWIELWRYPEATSDGAGGKVRTSRQPKLQAGARRFFSLQLFEPIAGGGNLQGSVLRELFVLVGMPGDDMVINDYFFVGGQKYRITKIHSDRSYQVKAEGWSDNNGD